MTMRPARVERQGSMFGAGLLRLTFVAVMAFLTVVDLFAAQVLLPMLTTYYAVSPATMGLAVNACTLGMAAGGIAVAVFGHRIPRRAGIVASLLLLSVPTLLLAVAPNVAVFSALRVLQGLAMSAAFGLTLAHLGERHAGENATSAIAAYITGNVASNLIGRLIATVVADHAGLSGAFLVLATMNVVGAALAFAFIDDQARPARSGSTPPSLEAALKHVRDPTLRAGFGIGFCILFAFIGTFTYINFELVKPPLALGMMQLGLIYFVFLPSIISTPFAGRAVEIFGAQRTLWAGLATASLGLPLLLVSRLAPVLVGMVLVAAGTFFAQAVATGFVSRAAAHNKSAASGLYLASYFLGGLVGSAVLGRVYETLGWTGCVAGVGIALAVAGFLSHDMHDANAR